MRTDSPLDAEILQVGSVTNSQHSSLGDVYTTMPTSTHVGSAISPNESATADRILHKEVHNANEALNLLYEAAAESRSDTDEGNAPQNSLSSRLTTKDDANVLAWREFWCVKAGWMTSVEAKCYVDLFFPTKSFANVVSSPI